MPQAACRGQRLPRPCPEAVLKGQRAAVARPTFHRPWRVWGRREALHLDSQVVRAASGGCVSAERLTSALARSHGKRGGEAPQGPALFCPWRYASRLIGDAGIVPIGRSVVGSLPDPTSAPQQQSSPSRNV